MIEEVGRKDARGGGLNVGGNIDGDDGEGRIYDKLKVDFVVYFSFYSP